MSDKRPTVGSVTDALAYVHDVTDCRNDVFEWASSRNGRKFFVEAEKLGLMVSETCVEADDDGFGKFPERHAIAYRLTKAGYDALQALDAERFDRRRFG